MLKILAFLTALFKIIPQIKQAIENYIKEREKKTIDDAIKKVDDSTTKEGLKKAVIDASKKFNSK